MYWDSTLLSETTLAKGKTLPQAGFIVCFYQHVFMNTKPGMLPASHILNHILLKQLKPVLWKRLPI
jgi:hypothetical protein